MNRGRSPAPKPTKEGTGQRARTAPCRGRSETVRVEQSHAHAEKVTDHGKGSVRPGPSRASSSIPEVKDQPHQQSPLALAGAFFSLPPAHQSGLAGLGMRHWRKMTWPLWVDDPARDLARHRYREREHQGLRVGLLQIGVLGRYSRRREGHRALRDLHRLWLLVFLVLSSIWFMTRPKRSCPRRR